MMEQYRKLWRMLPMAEKKKILYIVEAMGGGVFTYIVDLANELVNSYDMYIAYAVRKQTPQKFADLEKYKDEDFYKEHPMIQFRTIWGNEEYEILAAFTTPVYTGNDFNYYNFIKAQKGEDYEYFIREIKRKGIYETKVTACYGEKLLTLSTCEYSQKNGRMVVVAKKVERTGG